MKDEILKARVAAELAHDFLSLCDIQDRSASDVIRALVSEYVAKHKRKLDFLEMETTIEIVKRENQRHDRYLDVAYDVDVQVHTNQPESLLDEEVVFQLPEFNANGVEIARIDSASTYRAQISTSGKKERSDRNTINAKLKKLKWYGGLFIYTAEGQYDEQEYMQMVTEHMRSVIEKAVRRHVLSMEERVA